MLENFLNGLMFGLGFFVATFVASLLFFRFGRKLIGKVVSKLTPVPPEVRWEARPGWREREEGVPEGK